jgi:hypothetical protein
VLQQIFSVRVRCASEPSGNVIPRLLHHTAAPNRMGSSIRFFFRIQFSSRRVSQTHIPDRQALCYLNEREIPNQMFRPFCMLILSFIYMTRQPGPPRTRITGMHHNSPPQLSGHESSHLRSVVSTLVYCHHAHFPPNIPVVGHTRVTSSGPRRPKLFRAATSGFIMADSGFFDLFYYSSWR